MPRAEFDPAIPSLARPTWDQESSVPGNSSPSCSGLSLPLFREEGETRRGRIIHVTFCLTRVIAQWAQECRYL